MSMSYAGRLSWPLRLTALLVRGAALLCALSFAAFCALTLLQVVNRYVSGGALYWTEETVILLFVWSVMLGLPVALWSRDEIVVDLLQLSPGLARSLQIALAELLSLTFLLALAYSGMQLIARAGSATSPALELPRWLFYTSIPVGSGLAAVALLGRWWRDRTAQKNQSDSHHVAHAHD